MSKSEKSNIEKFKPHWYQLKKRVLESTFISELIEWSKRVSLPGFSGISIHDVSTFIYTELKRDDIVTRANSVAFSFFLSIFPLIIFVLPLLALTPSISEYFAQAEESFGDVIPNNAKFFFLDIIESIKREGSFGLQSISFIFAAIFSSSGMLTLMYGFDKSHDTSFKHRSYFRKRFVALNLTILLALIVAVSVFLLIVGQFVIAWLGHNMGLSGLNAILLAFLKWLIIFFLFYSTITVIYRYGPSIYRPLKIINPGAMLATVSSIIASIGFSFFINNFGRYNELYGSIGALIVFLLWLQINAFILLAGFELNASIIVNRDIQILQKNDQTQNC